MANCRGTRRDLKEPPSTGPPFKVRPGNWVTQLTAKFWCWEKWVKRATIFGSS